MAKMAVARSTDDLDSAAVRVWHLHDSPRQALVEGRPPAPGVDWRVAGACEVSFPGFYLAADRAVRTFGDGAIQWGLATSTFVHPFPGIIRAQGQLELVLDFPWRAFRITRRLRRFSPTATMAGRVCAR